MPDKDSLFTLGRNYVLSSVHGHTVAFKKGEPTFVPPPLRAEALAIGAVCEGAVDEDEEPTPDVVIVGPERDAKLRAGIEAINARNRREDFTAAGAPTVAALSREVGFTVSGKEIPAQVQALADARAAEAEAAAVTQAPE